MQTHLTVLILTSLVAQVILELPEDARLDFTGLATKYGYPCNEHTVTTEDGYILKVFHMPGNRSRPLLLMHGITDSADTFIIRGNNSLTAFMINQGYDIWLGNVRGNHYSRRHNSLDPDVDKEFWDYTYNEMAYYDLPAIIDYVLNKTKADKLDAIGHSQGNAIFYVLASLKPEYNEKVNLLIALAPIGYLNNLPVPWSVITGIGDVINSILIAFNTEEMFDKELRTSIQDLCEKQAELCSSVFGELAGPDIEEVETEFLPTAIGHYPTSTSRKNLLHILQNTLKKKFGQFDYGSSKNMEVYGSKNPPSYDLSKVRMKVAMYTGRNDRIATVENVILLRNQLPNVVEFRVMKRSKFNHMDHIWGKHMDKYLFPNLLKTLEKHNE